MQKHHHPVLSSREDDENKAKAHAKQEDFYDDSEPFQDSDEEFLQLAVVHHLIVFHLEPPFFPLARADDFPYHKTKKPVGQKGKEHKPHDNAQRLQPTAHRILKSMRLSARLYACLYDV